MDAGASALVGPQPVSAQAEQTQSFSATLPLTPTNFSTETDPDLSPLSVPKFSPDLGTLTSVDLTFQATVQGQIQVESLDQTPKAISPTLGGTVTLTLNGATLQPLTLVKNMGIFQAAAYDGQRDFSGPSGKTYPLTQQTKTETLTLNASTSDLSAFQGPGSFQANVAALGQSVVSGSGNMADQTNTQATATLSVVYHYTPSSAVGGQIISPPPNCPPATITGIQRYGVHRQSVVLVASFDQPLDRAQAANPSNYTLLSSGPDFRFGTADDQVVPVRRAVYDPASNTVRLFLAGGANVHRLYDLSVTTVVPCGTTQNNSVLFDRGSLSGFVSHRNNALVPLRHPVPHQPFSSVGNNQYTLLTARTEALLARRQLMVQRVNQLALMRQERLGH